MWTPATRGRMAKIEKKTKRYPSDLTDEEWARIEPFLPRASKAGRPIEVDLREVLNAIRYMAKASAALDEARSVAAKVVALELEALANRIKVEAAARSGTLGWRKQIALSQLAQRVVQENLNTSIAVKNSPDWGASNQEAEGWRARHAELLDAAAAPVEGAAA